MLCLCGTGVSDSAVQWEARSVSTAELLNPRVPCNGVAPTEWCFGASLPRGPITRRGATLRASPRYSLLF